MAANPRYGGRLPDGAVLDRPGQFDMPVNQILYNAKKGAGSVCESQAAPGPSSVLVGQRVRVVPNHPTPQIMEFMGTGSALANPEANCPPGTIPVPIPLAVAQGLDVGGIRRSQLSVGPRIAHLRKMGIDPKDMRVICADPTTASQLSANPSSRPALLALARRQGFQGTDDQVMGQFMSRVAKNGTPECTKEFSGALAMDGILGLHQQLGAVMEDIRGGDLDTLLGGAARKYYEGRGIAGGSVGGLTGAALASTIPGVQTLLGGSLAGGAKSARKSDGCRSILDICVAYQLWRAENADMLAYVNRFLVAMSYAVRISFLWNVRMKRAFRRLARKHQYAGKAPRFTLCPRKALDWCAATNRAGLVNIGDGAVITRYVEFMFPGPKYSNDYRNGVRAALMDPYQISVVNPLPDPVQLDRADMLFTFSRVQFRAGGAPARARHTGPEIRSMLNFIQVCRQPVSSMSMLLSEDALAPPAAGAPRSANGLFLTQNATMMHRRYVRVGFFMPSVVFEMQTRATQLRIDHKLAKAEASQQRRQDTVETVTRQLRKLMGDCEVLDASRAVDRRAAALNSLSMELNAYMMVGCSGDRFMAEVPTMRWVLRMIRELVTTEEDTYPVLLKPSMFKGFIDDFMSTAVSLELVDQMVGLDNGDVDQRVDQRDRALALLDR